MTNHTEGVLDTVKVGVAASAPMASFLGYTVEEWSYILSAVVALLFIGEKLWRFSHYLYRRWKEKDGCNFPK